MILKVLPDILFNVVEEKKKFVLLLLVKGLDASLPISSDYLMIEIERLICPLKESEKMGGRPSLSIAE